MLNCMMEDKFHIFVCAADLLCSGWNNLNNLISQLITTLHENTSEILLGYCNDKSVGDLLNITSNLITVSP